MSITNAITIDHLVKIRRVVGVGVKKIRVHFAWNMLEYYVELVSARTQSSANYLVVEYIPSSTVYVQALSLSLATAESQVLS